MLWDKQTERVIGGAIVGPNAGDLIAEVGFAVEMGADAADIGMTIHPHPTLSETVAFAAEAYDGTPDRSVYAQEALASLRQGLATNARTRIANDRLCGRKLT